MINSTFDFTEQVARRTLAQSQFKLFLRNLHFCGGQSAEFKKMTGFSNAL